MFRKPLILNSAKRYTLKMGGALLHIYCGEQACGDVNADIVPRNVPSFILLNQQGPLPFEDKQFSAIFSSDTLEYCESPLDLILEFQRVAEKVFIVIPKIWDFNFSSPKHRWLPIDRMGMRWIENPVWKIVAHFSERKPPIQNEWLNMMKTLIPLDWAKIKDQFQSQSLNFIEKIKNRERFTSDTSESSQEG